MDRELYMFIKFMVSLLALSITIILLLCSPFLYLEGAAKSEWFKQTRNIDIPWYKAAFLNVNTQDINANIKNNYE